MSGIFSVAVHKDDCANMGLPCGHSIGVVEKAFIIQLLTPSSVPWEVGVCLSVRLFVSWLVNWSIVLFVCRVNAV